MDAALRRLLDVAVAAALLLAAAPVLGLLAVLVRWTSPGPAFFRQTGIGRHGRPFELVKLRTMRSDAPSTGPAITAGAGPAHHVVGRAPPGRQARRAAAALERRARRHEPRRPAPRGTALRRALLPAARAALRVRPGLTDPASLALADEAAVLGRFDDPERVYAEEILPWKLALSLAYLERRTVWTDLGIVARTATHVGRAAVRAAWRQGDTP